jgi:hypothetical protein
VEGPIQTRLYQAQLLHKEFAQPLTLQRYLNLT